MCIGELASAAGVSVRVLRHYEAQGLIQSSRRANGYREYPKGVIETVRQVLSPCTQIADFRASLYSNRGQSGEARTPHKMGFSDGNAQ
jgi:DNA-binding transcriptional MerR regulator